MGRINIKERALIDFGKDKPSKNIFVMIYNKPSASKEIWKLQRWCNNKFIFKSVNNFSDY